MNALLSVTDNFLGHVAKDFQKHVWPHSGRNVVRSVLVLVLIGCLLLWNPAVREGRVDVPKEEKVVDMPWEQAPAYALQIEELYSRANDVSCKCNRDEDHIILQSVRKEMWLINSKFPWMDVIKSCQNDLSLNFTVYTVLGADEVCPGRDVKDASVLNALSTTWQLLSTKQIECSTMVERTLGKTIFLFKLLACFDAVVDTTRDRLLDSYMLANKTLLAEQEVQYRVALQAMQYVMGYEFLWGYLQNVPVQGLEGQRAALANATHSKLSRYNWKGSLALEHVMDKTGTLLPYVFPVNWLRRYREVVWVCHPYSCKWFQLESRGEAFWRIFDELGGGLELGSIVIFLALSVCFCHRAHSGAPRGGVNSHQDDLGAIHNTPRWVGAASSFKAWVIARWEALTGYVVSLRANRPGASSSSPGLAAEGIPFVALGQHHDDDGMV